MRFYDERFRLSSRGADSRVSCFWAVPCDREDPVAHLSPVVNLTPFKFFFMTQDTLPPSWELPNSGEQVIIARGLRKEIVWTLSCTLIQFWTMTRMANHTIKIITKKKLYGHYHLKLVY